MSMKKNLGLLSVYLAVGAHAIANDPNIFDRPQFGVKYPEGQESESKKVGSGKRARRRNRHKNKGKNNK